MKNRFINSLPTTGRRIFLKQIAGFVVSIGAWLMAFPQPFARVWAAARKVLPRGTNLETLVNENPAQIDPRDLEIEPLEKFGIMGLSDHPVELKDWRLLCTGQVNRELRLTYDQIRALPSLERPVLLICPGFFANYGRWKGISLAELAGKAGMKKGVTHVTVSGPAGPYEKTARFPWKDVEADKLFLAYQVNGETLPVKHGYPLRLVAEGVYGSDWVKYVYKVQFDRVNTP